MWNRFIGDVKFECVCCILGANIILQLVISCKVGQIQFPYHICDDNLETIVLKYKLPELVFVST